MEQASCKVEGENLMAWKGIKITNHREKFLEFHQANPDVYVKLKNLALELLKLGHHSYGIGSLFEVLRWHYALETTEKDFKLNNNYRAYYARLLMDQEPELQLFFDIRTSQADEEF
jgi:hypothetical protein